MAIDPSIPLQAKAPETNPFQTVGQALDIKNALLRNQQTQQQLVANTAMSQAIKDATDPKTGKIDYDKASALVANSPAAYNLPQFQGQIAQQRLQNLQLDSQQLELQMKRNQALTQQIGGLLQDPNTTPQTVIAATANAVQRGLIDPQTAAAGLQTMPSDPAGLKQWLHQHYLQGLDVHDQLSALQPSVMAVNAGNRTELINTNTLGNVPFGQIGTIQQGLSPEAATAPTQVYDPQTGTMRSVTRAQFAQMAQGGGGGGGLPQLGQPGYTGAYPSGGGAPGVQTAPALGQQAAAEVTAKGAADRYNKLQQDAAQVRNSVQGYDRALALVDQAFAGPGSGKLADLSGIANTLGIPVQSGKATSTQELNKYLANAAAQAAESAGYNGSDLRTTSFFQGQPGAGHMNAEALKNAITYVKAQQIGALSKSDSATSFVQAHNGDVSQLPRFEQQWNRAYNPEAMYFMTLPDAEKAKYAQKLPAAERASLAKHVAAMDQLGAFSVLGGD